VKNDVEAWCQSLNKPIAVHLERSAPAAKTPRDTGMPRGSEAHQWTTTSERFHGASMNFSPSWQPLTRHDFIPRASSAVKDPNNPHVPKRLDSKPEGTQAELRPPSSRLYGTAAAHLAAAGDRALGKEVTRVATPWRPESDRWATPVRLRQAGTAIFDQALTHLVLQEIKAISLTILDLRGLDHIHRRQMPGLRLLTGAVKMYQQLCNSKRFFGNDFVKSAEACREKCRLRAYRLPAHKLLRQATSTRMSGSL